MSEQARRDPAFPSGMVKVDDRTGTVLVPMMELRDHFAMNAPIDGEFVARLYGVRSPAEIPLSNDGERSVYLALHALACYEWADAMLTQRERRND